MKSPLLRIGAWVSLLGVLTIGMAALVYWRVAGDLTDGAQADLLAMAQAKRDQLEAFLDARRGETRLFAFLGPVHELLETAPGRPIGPEVRQRLDLLIGEMGAAAGVRAIRLLDSDLRVRAGADGATLSEADRAAARLAMRTRQSAFTAVHAGAGGRAEFGVLFPVVARRNPVADGPVGMVHLDIDLVDRIGPILTSWPTAMRSAESVLVRRDGEQIVYLTPLRHLPAAAPLSVRRPLADSASVLARAIRGGQLALGTGLDYRGVRVIGAALPVRGTDWTLSVKVDYDEFAEPMRRLASGIAITTILLLGALGTAAGFWWQVRQGQLLTELSTLGTRLRAAAATTFEAYFVADAEGRIIDANQAAEELVGHARTSLEQMTLANLCPLDAGARLTDLLARARRGGGRGLLQCQTSAGALIEVSASASYVEHAGRGEFHIFAHDVTGELRAQRRIGRLGQYYRFLSQVNGAIFTMSSEQEIYEGVCHGAVEQGAFLLAWVGVPDPVSGVLQPVAAAGAAAHCVRDVVITLDPALGTSEAPARLCMVGREVVSVDDFGTDPRTAPWVELAGSHGIRSCAAVPLLVEGETIAALSFYSGEAGYFDAEMRALLTEAARNVSLALQAGAARKARAAAEAAQQSSEVRFDQVFQASQVAMQIMSLSTRMFRSVNLAHERAFGYSREQVPDQDTWLRTLHPDAEERARVRAAWEEDLRHALVSGAGAAPAWRDVELKAADGNVKYGRAFVTVIGDDVVMQWLDLTEVRRAETRLAESERRFRGLIEQMVSGVYVAQDDRIVYANPRMCAILGQPLERVIGRNAVDALGVDAVSREQINLAREALRTGRNIMLQVAYRRSASEVVELDVSATLGNWDGRPAGVVMVQDISERRRAEERIAAYVKQLEGTMDDTLRAVSNMVEMRDPYTAGHEQRVGLIAADIAREMGWPEERCDNLKLIGLVHDIGKIGVPAEILTKPTRLTDLERAMVREHAQRGFEILRHVRFPLPIAEIIHQHHEHLDGSGYPQGLKGDQILPEARVLTVADVLEAMASHRPYRAARGRAAAFQEILAHRGDWYDPEVVDALRRLLEDKDYQLPAS